MSKGIQTFTKFLLLGIIVLTTSCGSKLSLKSGLELDPQPKNPVQPVMKFQKDVNKLESEFKHSYTKLKEIDPRIRLEEKLMDDNNTTGALTLEDLLINEKKEERDIFSQIASYADNLGKLAGLGNSSEAKENIEELKKRIEQITSRIAEGIENEDEKKVLEKHILPVGSTISKGLRWYLAKKREYKMAEITSAVKKSDILNLELEDAIKEYRVDLIEREKKLGILLQTYQIKQKLSLKERLIVVERIKMISEEYSLLKSQKTELGNTNNSTVKNRINKRHDDLVEYITPGCEYEIVARVDTLITEVRNKIDKYLEKKDDFWKFLNKGTSKGKIALAKQKISDIENIMETVFSKIGNIKEIKDLNEFNKATKNIIVSIKNNKSFKAFKDKNNNALDAIHKRLMSISNGQEDKKDSQPKGLEKDSTSEKLEIFCNKSFINRRDILNKSFTENKKLAEVNIILKKEIKALKEEEERIKKYSKYLAKFDKYLEIAMKIAAKAF